MLHPDDFQSYTGLMKVITGGKVRACAFFFCSSRENCNCCCWPWRLLDSLSAPVAAVSALCSTLFIHFVLLWHDLRLYNGWGCCCYFSFFLLLRSPPAAAMALHTIRRREPLFDLLAYIHVCSLYLIKSAASQRHAAIAGQGHLSPAHHLSHLSSSNYKECQEQEK